MLFSFMSSLIIILAIPFGIRAIYISSNINLMSLIFIEFEIILDSMITVVVLYNIIFGKSESRDSHYYADEDQERGIKEMLSNNNIDKLQKEVLKAYKQIDFLNFETEKSRREESSPERTFTDNSDKNKRDFNDRNSFYPISEIEGEKSASNDFNNSLRNEFYQRKRKMESVEGNRQKYVDLLEPNDQLRLQKNKSDISNSKSSFRQGKRTSKNTQYDSAKMVKNLMDDIKNCKIQGKVLYLII